MVVHPQRDEGGSPGQVPVLGTIGLGLEQPLRALEPAAGHRELQKTCVLYREYDCGHGGSAVVSSLQVGVVSPLPRR
jgi:hypothetical protein